MKAQSAAAQAAREVGSPRFMRAGMGIRADAV